MMVAAEIIASIIECIIMTEFLTRFLGIKNKNYALIKFLSCFLLLLADNLLMPLVGGSELLPVAIMLAIEMVYSIVFLKGEIYKKIFVVFISCITMLLINMTVLMLIGNLLQIDIAKLTVGTDAVRLMILFLTKFLFFLITRALLKLKADERYRFSRNEWLMLTAIFVMTFFIGIAVLENVVHGENKEIFMFSSVLGLVLTNIITYMLIIRMIRQNTEHVKNAVLEAQIKGEEKTIQEVNRMYAEIQQIRHDIKHWASGSLALIKQGEYSRAEEYLSVLLSDKIGALKNYAVTDVPMINAIINLKLTWAEEKGIEIRTVMGTELGKLDYYELSIVIANMLDNAIEACGSIEGKKQIYYEMGMDGAYLKILVKNTYDGGEINLHTKKNNKKLHGFGTKGIQKYCEENDGILNFYEQDGYFCADLWLKTEEQSAQYAVI